MYHTVRWHNEFAAPMTTLLDRSCLFVNDFLSFKDPDLGIVTGKLLKCFLKVIPASPCLMIVTIVCISYIH